MENEYEAVPCDEECIVCGRDYPHRHTDLTWDETWGFIPGPADDISAD